MQLSQCAERVSQRGRRKQHYMPQNTSWRSRQDGSPVHTSRSSAETHNADLHRKVITCWMSVHMWINTSYRIEIHSESQSEKERIMLDLKTQTNLQQVDTNTCCCPLVVKNLTQLQRKNPLNVKHCLKGSKVFLNVCDVLDFHVSFQFHGTGERSNVCKSWWEHTWSTEHFSQVYFRSCKHSNFAISKDVDKWHSHLFTLGLPPI